MSLSPDQLAQRRMGITATDAAAISGLHPYRAPIDVFLDKTGRAAPFAGNTRTKWGDLLEPVVRDDYAERHGVRVEVPGTLTHSEVPWAMATPDGVCYLPRQARPRNGLEIKTHSFRVADQYGDPGTDEVPTHELVQCVWSMFVTGLDSWDLVAFIDGQPAEYRIERDDELIGLLRTDAERFLVDHVNKDVPPDPDGSSSYNRYLSTAYPQRTHSATCVSRLKPPKPCDCVAGMLVSLDDKPGARAMVRDLRAARERFSQVETEVEILTQNLKAVIGNNAGLEWADAEGKKGRSSISYRLSKDGSNTDWQAAWRSLVTEAQLVLSSDPNYREIPIEPLVEALVNIADEQRSISLHTNVVPGSRRFLCPRAWSKNTNKED
jgi:putative phage-type endonuclease